MLWWTFLFFLMAVVAGVLGFSGMAGAFATVAKFCLVFFLALAIISFFSRAVQGKSVA